MGSSASEGLHRLGRLSCVCVIAVGALPFGLAEEPLCDPSQQGSCSAPDPVFVARDAREYTHDRYRDWADASQEASPGYSPKLLAGQDLEALRQAAPEELLRMFDDGLWRRVTGAEAVLLVTQARERALADRSSERGTEAQDEFDRLSERIEEYWSIVSGNPEREFLTRAHRAISLLEAGSEKCALDLLRPFLKLENGDPLLSPASEVAARANMQLGGFARANQWLEKCAPTERVLYMRARCHLALGSHQEAAALLLMMKDKYPEGRLTSNMQKLRNALNGMGIWKER